MAAASVTCFGGAAAAEAEATAQPQPAAPAAPEGAPSSPGAMCRAFLRARRCAARELPPPEPSMPDRHVADGRRLCAPYRGTCTAEGPARHWKLDPTLSYNTWTRGCVPRPHSSRFIDAEACCASGCVRVVCGVSPHTRHHHTASAAASPHTRLRCWWPAYTVQVTSSGSRISAFSSADCNGLRAIHCKPCE